MKRFCPGFLSAVLCLILRIPSAVLGENGRWVIDSFGNSTDCT